MLELDAAVARGALARVTVLREERRTDAAQIIFEQIDSGALGRIPRVATAFTAEAALRERADCERIRLHRRRQTAASLAAAHELADDILARVGPRASSPTLDGENRLLFLSHFATALSDLGDETAAIAVTEFILTDLGQSEHDAFAAALQEGSRSAQARRRIAIQLSNLSVRRTRLGFLARLAGDLEEARRLFELARRDAEQSMRLREGRAATDAYLLSRFNMLRPELELAVAVDELEERDRAIESVQRELLDVVRSSYERPTVSPRSRLIRAGAAGMALVERALISESQGDAARARSLASTARSTMKATVDLWRYDTDETVAVTVRYGEACRLAGSPERAERIWSRTRDRLALLRGETAPAVGWLENRLLELRGRSR